MPEQEPYLCDGCPGKGNIAVDFDVQGFCVATTADSFKQTRGYKLGDERGDYGTDESLVKLSASALRYFDPDEGEYFEKQGNIEAAQLGLACAKRFLAGECPKSRDTIIVDSEID